MRDRIFAALAIAALAVYSAWLFHHTARSVGGSDSSGYANAARSILAGRIVERVVGLDELGLDDRFAPALTPLAFSPGPRPRTMVPFYPPGFPMHIAAATALVGSGRGVFLANPVAAGLCLLLMFLLGRELGLSRPWSAAGAAILGACPVFVWDAVQPMSDLVATLWALAAVLAALRSRRRAGWALAAGAALGIAVLVRPTNSLLTLPVLLALARRPKTLALTVAGGLPFALFYLTWNHLAYGGILRTGYSGALASDLSLEHFGARLAHYGTWLVAQLSPLIPLGWMALAADRQAPRRDRLVLLAWFLPFLVLHAFWASYHQWWYTRFLLPGLPAMIVGALLVARDSLRWVSKHGRWRRLGGPAAVVLLAVVVRAEWQVGHQVRPIELANQDARFSEGCRALAEQVGAGKALVVSMEFSGAVRYFNGLVPLRWDAISPPDFAVVAERAAAKGYGVYAALLSAEVEPARSHVPGHWVPVARSLGGVTIWRITPGRAANCPAGATPTPETCNGVDDDCDGVVDDLSRASYSESAVPLGAFRAKNSGCTPTDEATWLACNNAIHLHCREVGCRTSGIGSFEWSAESSATVACLSTPPPLEVTKDELAPFGACPLGRPLGPSDRFRCAQAIHAFCRSLGYPSGFGPVGAAGASAWRIVCLEQGSARTLATTYRALARFHDGCVGGSAAAETPTYCMSAAKRLCVDSGYAAGFGPVADADGKSPTIVCVDY